LRLERTINRWASEVLHIAPASVVALQEAVLADIGYVRECTALFTDVRPVKVQYLLRHALAQMISEGIINSLIVTDSVEANLEFTRAHERLLTRTLPSHPVKRSPDSSPSQPTTAIPRSSHLPFPRVFFSPEDVAAAAAWRRQTFSVAAGFHPPEMMQRIFEQIMPLLAALLPDSAKDPLGTRGVLQDAFKFSCMLRNANPGTDALYRSFVPELASTLDPGMVELVNPCRRSERGEVDCVALTVFPGLVEILPTPPIAEKVVRRAQVICECEFLATSDLLLAPPPPLPLPPPLTM
jgi:hypothetical protein